MPVMLGNILLVTTSLYNYTVYETVPLFSELKL